VHAWTVPGVVSNGVFSTQIASTNTLNSAVIAGVELFGAAGGAALTGLPGIADRRIAAACLLAFFWPGLNSRQPCERRIGDFPRDSTRRDRAVLH
jgi:hypothetical protein